MDVKKNVGTWKYSAATKAAPKKFAWFTLVELIVVITILAILATIGLLALSGYSQDAKESAIKANVRSIQTAISTESAITNQSPRFYIIHDSGAALAWTFAYADENPVVLTGGIWNVVGTNYSAGNPDYAKLKINPDKFRISDVGVNEFVENAFAAYSSTGIVIGAFDYGSVSTNGKPRSGSYFQVAAVMPDTKKAVVTGTYPSSGWLIKESMYWAPMIDGTIPSPTYSISWTFWIWWGWSRINLCWTSVIANSSWNFTASFIAEGAACNNVTAAGPGYYCSTTVNGPASLASNVSNITGTCLQVSAEYGPVNFSEAQAQCSALWAGWKIPERAQMVNPWTPSDSSVLFVKAPSLFGAWKMYWLNGKNSEGGRLHGQLLSVPGGWNHYENCEDNANTCTYFNWTSTAGNGYYGSVWTLYVRCVK